MKIVEDLDLTPYNSYRIRARCARAFFPETEADLLDLYDRSASSRRVLIGSGHNVILGRAWYDADFVILNGNFNRVQVDGTTMIAEAGAFSKAMSLLALESGLTGFEVFCDIPSSLGGAIVMNASSSGEGIEHTLDRVRFLDTADMRVREVGASEIGLGYRTSIFQDESMVVLQAWLKLKRAKRTEIRRKMEEIKRRRHAKQPRDLPNAGSVFKRPLGRFVGPMIDELGLRGFSVGGFQVSTKHGGFIVNHGTGSGDDLLELIRIIKERVKAAYGIDLELEQKILG